MQINENRSEGLRRELKVTVAASELDVRLSGRLEELKTRVRIKGFRPGKVPMSHLRRLYGKAAMAEIVESLVGETARQAIAERGERAAMQPKVAMTEDEAEAAQILQGEADLVFTLEYEILPKFELSDFKGLKVERPVVAVTDDDVEQRLRQVGESARPFQPVERPAAEGDRVSFSYVGKRDGETFEANSTAIVLGTGQFIPGFEAALKGVAAGAEKTIDITFPENYPAAELAGKPATFDVSVTEVAEPGELSLDDEFAARLGLESVDQLRQTLRNQIAGEFAQATRQRVKRQLLDQLDALHSFPLPENLVEQEFANIWRQVEHDVQHHGRPPQSEGAAEEDARQEYRGIAERRVRLGLVLSQIGESAEVAVSDEELQGALYNQARRFRGQEKQVFEYYRKNPDALHALRAPIFEEKVIDYILEFADLTDKPISKEELLAGEDEEEGLQLDHGHVGHDHGHGDHDHGHVGHDHGHDDHRAG